MRSILLLLVLGCGGSALAHATLVFGVLSSSPAAPRALEAFTLRLELLDPTQTPVEDAYVIAEFRQSPEDEPISAILEESDTPGRYETVLTLSTAGVYQLLLRDQTFRQEEAQAELQIVLGEEPLFPEGADAILFPPTATRWDLRSILVFVVALPVLAGIVVTVLVLRGTASAASKDEPTDGAAPDEP